MRNVRSFLLVLGIAVTAGPSAAPHAASVGARSTRTVLPFIDDDYRRAVAEARARKVPLFIEAWAPW